MYFHAISTQTTHYQQNNILFFCVFKKSDPIIENYWGGIKAGKVPLLQNRPASRFHSKMTTPDICNPIQLTLIQMSHPVSASHLFLHYLLLTLL